MLNNSLYLIIISICLYLFIIYNSNTSNKKSSLYDDFIIIHPDVQYALDNNLPIVALESTIISHGMPYPQNIETAKRVEQVIRDNGAIPATIAIIDQHIHIGLTDNKLDRIGKEGLKSFKTSRRDIANILSKSNAIGTTTVSGTMILANYVGISVFVTGGIGGVHHGAETTMDISADLTELGRTPVTVVSAGIKSILDLGLTLEYLETQGVTVIGYQTDKLPAFFIRESEYSIPIRMNNTLQIAQLMNYNHKLQLNSGILVTCPIPNEYSADSHIISNAINKALQLAEENNIKGKDITPFLLESVNNLTNGKSLEANIQLILNNAKIGALIAKDYTNINKKK